MKPNGMDGENQFSAILIPSIKNAAAPHAKATSRGVKKADKYHFRLKRHSSE